MRDKNPTGVKVWGDLTLHPATALDTINRNRLLAELHSRVKRLMDVIDLAHDEYGFITTFSVSSDGKDLHISMDATGQVPAQPEIKLPRF